MVNKSTRDYLEILNFGPIDKVKIQLEGLSVIIGPNNSGKSTFSNILFALNRSMERYLLRIYDVFISKAKYVDYEPNIIEYVDNLINILQNNGNNLQLIQKYIDTLKKIIEKEVISKQNDYEENEKRINEFGSIFSQEIKSIFQDSISNLIRTGQKNACLRYQNGYYEIKIIFSLNEFGWTDIKIDQFRIVSIDFSNSFNLKSSAKFSLNFKPHTNQITKFGINENDLQSDIIRSCFRDFIDNISINEILYLPPGRSMISQNIDLYTSIASDNVRYSLPNTIRNFLSRYSRGISNFEQRNISKEKHATYFLTSLFKGSLEIDTEYGSKSLIFRRNDNRSPLQRTASMIQDLAGIPVILFGSGDRFLLVEEPEAHLHPENQVIFAKWLVKYIYSYQERDINPKIIITTHSENIIAELENIIALCRVNFHEEILEKFDEDLFINWRNIQLYSFEESSNGSYNSTEISKMSKGFEGEVFGETIDKIYEEYQQIVEFRNKFGETNE